MICTIIHVIHIMSQSVSRSAPRFSDSLTCVASLCDVFRWDFFFFLYLHTFFTVYCYSFYFTHVLYYYYYYSFVFYSYASCHITL